ncbi:CLUMA_CG018326, isoform A [Clunio marinus]|uniref:CLUMA_CG018326, isoform A n=1 Tax=Clunio marinus TaxID=568069 RepID=A0A1J1IYS5_9DIPT|nr:CLUMA_CG018326, isoform A [Clunio marinus]
MKQYVAMKTNKNSQIFQNFKRALDTVICTKPTNLCFSYETKAINVLKLTKHFTRQQICFVNYHLNLKVTPSLSFPCLISLRNVNDEESYCYDDLACDQEHILSGLLIIKKGNPKAHNVLERSFCVKEKIVNSF